jgi:hypothetical protein
MVYLLREMEEQDCTDLEYLQQDSFSGIDLSTADTTQLLELLSPGQKKLFEKWVKQGDFNSVVEQYVPWWDQDNVIDQYVPLIQDMDEPQRNSISKIHIPDPAILAAALKAHPSLVFTVIDMLMGYIIIMYHHSGDLNDPIESVDVLRLISYTIELELENKSFIYQDINQVLELGFSRLKESGLLPTVIETECSDIKWKESSVNTSGKTMILDSLLKVVERKAAMLKSLTDLFRLVQCLFSFTLKNRYKRKNIFRLMKKVEFLIAVVMQLDDTILDFLKRDIISFATPKSDIRTKMDTFHPRTPFIQVLLE